MFGSTGFIHKASLEKVGIVSTWISPHHNLCLRKMSELLLQSSRVDTAVLFGSSVDS